MATIQEPVKHCASSQLATSHGISLHCGRYQQQFGMIPHVFSSWPVLGHSVL